MSAPEQRDTIAARATPSGRGGIGVVRVSGNRVPDIARALAGQSPVPRQATLCTFRDERDQPLDQGLMLYFQAPASFTGEEVLELQGHGGPLVMARLLERVLALGARQARPGEFSERAFLNDKLDLAQAEAVADLIDATSREAASAAMRSLEGAFSREVYALVEDVTQLRVYLEAAIDFPDEETDFLTDGHVTHALSTLKSRFKSLEEQTRRGAILNDGMTIVLAGRPNVGKSCLLNRLAQRDTAIVTEIPGTTRDILREQIQIDGLAVNFIDTAGLRESDDPVEREGVARARAAMASADRILLLLDDREGLTEADRRILDTLPAGPAVTRLYNKCDLTGIRTGPTSDPSGDSALRLSALHGAGLDALAKHLKTCAGLTGGEGAFTARQRHVDALERASRTLREGARAFAHNIAGELLAEDLRAVQEELGRITGEVTNEDLLGQIFSSFCIGK